MKNNNLDFRKNLNSEIKQNEMQVEMKKDISNRGLELYLSSMKIKSNRNKVCFGVKMQIIGIKKE